MENEEKAVGIKCPKCGSTNTVIYKAPFKKGRMVKPLPNNVIAVVCKDCKHVFYYDTVEKKEWRS